MNFRPDPKPEPRKKKAKKGINKVSKHRKEQNDLYKIVRPIYLKDHPICEKCEIKHSDQIHHKKGREGWLLVAVEWFMAVCDGCHKYIEAHPTEAILNGWSISRTETEFNNDKD